MRYAAFIILLFLSLNGCYSSDEGIGGSGFIETTEVVISSETSGRVIKTTFDEGDNIAKGDTLAVIDPTRIQLELASASAGRKVALANLNTARIKVEKARQTEKYTLSEKERVSQLVKSSTASRKQYDRAEYEHKVAMIGFQSAEGAVASLEAQLTKIDADLARLERQLEDCYPTACISGTVTEKHIDKGELLIPGHAIITIAVLDTVWVKVYLPVNDFSTVKIGDNANVDTEAGQTYKGNVIWTSDEAEFTPKNVQTKKSRANLVYAVKVQIPNIDGALKIGMPVYVTLGE
ncbi:MAG: efflux RND transporter periplasmic adaptor subunit [candidate division Zixibacteria bacterium]|nr:efflux RND transporter periplasmic adaptor subunit [candidate division Zixibacteria bacterium]